LPELKDDVTIKRNKAQWEEGRKIAMVSSGVHLDGCCLPAPDPSHPESLILGVQKRFGYKPPTPEPKLLQELREFVLDFCRENLVPLKPDSDTTVERWLANTGYEAWRKEELLDINKNEENPFDPRHAHVKSFQKEEQYDEYKYPRAINARTDFFKTLVGPIFKLIEEEVFKLPWFIKKTPRHEWAAKIMETLDPNATIVATDYTAFEAHFIKTIMENIEFVMYDYMTQHLPEGNDFRHLVHEVLAGRNVCKFKYFTLNVLAVRMSGEMCTSLGNGFANLMLFMFACKKSGATDLRGFVEGDDGLFSLRGQCPRPELFARLGFTIKLAIHARISTASFCGMVFDEEDKINVTNPIKVLAKLGICSSAYVRARDSKLKTLLKAKALSNAAQYPQCPIVIAATRWVVRCLKHIDLRPYFASKNVNDYEKSLVREALNNYGKLESLINSPVPIKTRLLVEDLYDIPVDVQVRMEGWFDKQTQLRSIDSTILKPYIPAAWAHFYDNYSVVINVRDKWIESATDPIRHQPVVA